MGDSRDSSFHISASALSLLALDDGARQEFSHDSHRGLRGVAVWMVCCAMLHRFDVPHFYQGFGICTCCGSGGCGYVCHQPAEYLTALEGSCLAVYTRVILNMEPGRHTSNCTSSASMRRYADCNNSLIIRPRISGEGD